MSTIHRILLAEDDRFLRKAAETMLKRAGFTVIPAADGEEALRLARERGAHDYIIKSNIALEQLVERVRAFFVERAA